MLPRIRVTADGRSLETETGQPFFWLGDTAWELLQRLTLPEIEHFLTVRAGQGFNVVQVVALAEFGSLGPNTLGEAPLIEHDPARPNPAFFALVDDVLERAAQHGVYVALLPTWADKVTPDWGAGPVVFNPDKALAYGRWLGERYRSSTNIIWMLGGDRPAVYERDGVSHDQRDIWRAMAHGILERAGASALLMYHPPGGPTHRTATHLHDEPWLMVNAAQSGHGGGHDVPIWDWISEDLARLPHKPTLDLEPNYEDHPVNPWPVFDAANGYFRDHDVRKQLWRGVLAGACGVTYGHHAVWQFAAPGRELINHADRTWFEAIQRPGAVQAGVMRRCIESFLPRLEPAQDLIASGAGVGAGHVRAAWNATRSRALLYVPNTQVLRINLALLAGERVAAHWFDPRLGSRTRIDEFDATGERLFATPTHGPDWVLMLETNT